MTTQVLLIDPDIAFMVDVKKALEGTGDFKVSVAANGWTADELLRHGNYDVAVAAFGLSDMDIMELLDRLREIQPDLPVVATPTAYDDYLRIPVLDVQGNLPRPYKTRELIPVIEAAQQAKVGTVRPLRRDDPEPQIDHDQPLDPYVPPDTPAGIANLIGVTDTDETESPSPTELLDQVERAQLGETAELSDTEPGSATGPLHDPAAILEEFEELERIQTGMLGEDDALPQAKTGQLADEFEAMFPSDPFGFDEGLDEVYDLEETDQPEHDITADGTRILDEYDQIEDPPDTSRLRDLAAAAADIASGGHLLDDDGDDDYALDEIEIDYPSSTTDADEADLFDAITIEEPPATRKLRDMDADEALDETPEPTRMLESPADVDGTRILDLPDEPPDTTTLLQWDEPEETRRLRGTEALERERQRQPQAQNEQTALDDTELLQWDAAQDAADPVLPVTRPLAPRDDEPPRKEGDTPPVPEHDLDGVRQFLATDYSDQDPDDFGEALDAVAQSTDRPGERSPEDRKFSELVDSLRTPDQDLPRRRRLEELLNSLAADVQKDLPDGSSASTVDRVLDAVRRGESPRPRRSPAASDDLDDTTIGDVIDGLFDPSFEGVLAALAGEDVDEAEIDEPTYDAIDMEAEGGHASLFDEPPIDPEDSRHYPATTALTAVAGDDEAAGEFSLDDLLRQIETQLPPARTYRPQLKPLPSWGQDELLTGRGDIEALFDHAEGVERERPTLADVAEVQDGAGPTFDDSAAPEKPVPADDFVERMEPDISEDDTLPSATLLDVMDSVQEYETRPLGLVVPDAYEPTDVLTSEAEPADDEAVADEAVADEVAAPGFEGEPDFYAEDVIDSPEPDRGMLTMDDLLAIADLPAEAGTEEIQQEIAQRAAAAARRERGEQADDVPHDFAEQEDAAESSDDDYYDDAALPGTDGREIDRAEHAARSDVFVPGEEPDFHPEDSQMITLPATKAAELIEAEKSPVEEIEDSVDDVIIAGMAVQLTQFALESSAQALLISRPGERLVDAGDLSDEAMDDLFLLVDNAWRSSPAESNSLIRFIALPEVGEFLLYSTLVEHDLILSMVFSSDIPVRTIRRQARRLSESLELVPEVEEPPAAATSPSRPTDLVPPEGWQETVEAAANAAVSVPVRPDHPDPDEPYAAFTCVWLPADPTLELQDDLADALERWIDNFADNSAWYLGDLAILPDYILLTLHTPQKMLPDEVVATLMAETEDLMAEHFPLVAKGLPLWTDGYYVVSPPRDLSEREIARFITYQRQAQLG